MVTDRCDSTPSPGHTSGPNKPQTLKWGNKEPPNTALCLAKSGLWLTVLELLFNKTDSLHKWMQCLSLHQPVPSQTSTPNFPLYHHGVQARCRRAPCPGCLGPGHRQPCFGAGGPHSHWRQQRGTPSFSPRLTAGLILLLQADAGLFSGCPVLARHTFQISAGNH